MKKFADMTIDEAIAYTQGRVPECGPKGVELMPYPGGPERQLPLRANEAYPREYHALFFRAAWVWLISSGAHYELPFEFHRHEKDGPWNLIRMPMDAPTQRLEHESTHPTEIHALCAACLLAKGEVVP